MAMKRLIFPLFLLTLVGVNLAAEWSCSSPQSSGVFTRATSCQLAGQSVTVGNADSLAIVGSIGANNVVPEISGTGTHRLFKVEQGGKLTRVKNMETGQEQFRAEDILKYYNE